MTMSETSIIASSARQWMDLVSLNPQNCLRRTFRTGGAANWRLCKTMGIGSLSLPRSRGPSHRLSLRGQEVQWYLATVTNGTTRLKPALISPHDIVPEICFARVHRSLFYGRVRDLYFDQSTRLTTRCSPFTKVRLSNRLTLICMPC